MSNPSDPFQRNDKTVLRLNPGGRRATPPGPTAPAPAPAPPPYQAPPAYQPPPAYQQPPQATPYQPAPAYQQPPAYQPPPAYQQPPGYANPAYPNPAYQPPQSPGAAPDSWFTPPPPPPPPSTTGGARALIIKRDVPVAANVNVLLEAAGPLLLLLGRLRTSLMSANFANLMEQVADAIDEFDKTTRAESVPAEMANEAKYILAATADDIVQNIPSEERHVWAQYSMLSRFFNERVGGVRFFEKLEAAKRDARANYDLLELFYACLAVGFQGIHRTQSGGAAQLQAIERNLYETLRSIHAKTRDDISPHWRGQSLKAAGSTFRVPFWALSSVAALLLFGVYITFRLLLAGNAEAVTVEMGRLFPDTQLGIERAAVPVPAPPVPIKTSSQLERIRARLADEIAQNKVDPVESGQSIVVRVGSFALFESGEATVIESFKPIAVKIAEALDQEPGDIRIVGHTDNVRIVTARFPSNFELSVERANAVAALLKSRLRDPSRVRTEGKGESVPIATNQTAEGRARNRRVDITLPREETLAQRR